MAATVAMESLSLEAASIIVERALAVGRELKLRPLAVAVLDPRGCLKAYKAEDGATLVVMNMKGLVFIDVATGKVTQTLDLPQDLPGPFNPIAAFWNHRYTKYK